MTKAQQEVPDKRRGYTVIFRNVAQDKRLSLKTRGLFLLMQSLPENWKFTVSGLASMAGVGVRQIRAALKELEEVGYLVREQSHAESGTFAGNVWIWQKEAPSPLRQNVTVEASESGPLRQNVTAETSESKPLRQNALTRNGALNNTNRQNTPLPPEGDGERLSEKPKANGRPQWKPERFNAFWDFYRANSNGRPVGNRQTAARAWDKLKADDNAISLMGAALMKQVNGEMWRRGVGVPYASTWLNQRRWEDDSPDAPDNPTPDSYPEVTGWRT